MGAHRMTRGASDNVPMPIRVVNRVHLCTSDLLAGQCVNQPST